MTSQRDKLHKLALINSRFELNLLIWYRIQFTNETIWYQPQVNNQQIGNEINLNYVLVFMDQVTSSPDNISYPLAPILLLTIPV